MFVSQQQRESTAPSRWTNALIGIIPRMRAFITHTPTVGGSAFYPFKSSQVLWVFFPALFHARLLLPLPRSSHPALDSLPVPVLNAACLLTSACAPPTPSTACGSGNSLGVGLGANEMARCFLITSATPEFFHTSLC